MTSLVLDHGAANQLAAALAFTVARRHGLQCLLIKGHASQTHGVTGDRTAADIDLLVNPDDIEVLVAALEACGWAQRLHSKLGDMLAWHAVTMSHPQWPTDIDVHRYFPGLLAHPSTAFGVLWQRRAETELAGVSAAMVDAPSSLILEALHSQRTPRSRVETNGEERDDMVRRAFGRLDPSGVMQVRALARELGASSTLDEYLLLASSVDGSPLRPAARLTAASSVDERDWLRLATSPSIGAALIWNAIRAARGRRRCALLRSALWPDNAGLLRDYPATAPAPRSLLKLRLERALRGARSVLVLAATEIKARCGPPRALTGREDNQ